MSDSQPQSGTVYNPFLYNASLEQLQKYLLLAVVVAGKVDRIKQEKLDQFLRNASDARATEGFHPHASPFELILYLIQFNLLRKSLEGVRMGQYTRVEKAYRTLVCKNLDLRTCSRDDLCEIPGIGMKTASFFILFSRPKVLVACLDTHILQYMAENRLADNIPRATPTRKRYLELEKVFIEHCQVQDLDIAEYDFSIWLARNRGDKQLIAKKKS